MCCNVQDLDRHTSLRIVFPTEGDFPLKGLLAMSEDILGGFAFFFFLGLHPWHMEVPRLGVESGP